MKLLIFGSDGQLGMSLRDKLQNSEYEVIFLTKKDLDITDLKATEKKICDSNPNVIINASAYTDVDQAEINIEEADNINNTAVKNIAETCKKMNIWLIHISTDYVFDGLSEIPYIENDFLNPQGVYGRTKLEGEIAIRESLCNFVIIRTSWVYSQHGKNFLKTMLELCKTNSQLRIVNDQIGTPTYAIDLAKAIIKIIPYLKNTFVIGTYHFAGNKSCSWAEFAYMIFNQAFSLKKITKIPKIIEINSSEHQSIAKRPSNSRLNSSKFINTFEFNASNLKEGIIDSIIKIKS